MTAMPQKPETKHRYEFVPFYYMKETRDGDRVPVISMEMLINCYRELGFRRLSLGDSHFTIRISDNIIEEVDDVKFMDIFEDYVKSFGETFPDGVVTARLINNIYHNMSKYTATKFLNRVGQEEHMHIQEDTQHSAFFFYQNGFVEVTADAVTLKPYSQLTGKVWRNQMLPRHFTLLDDPEQGPFATFVKNVANAWETRFYDEAVNPKADPLRYRHFKQMIGNGLHGFVDAGKMRAVIMTDSRLDDNASGRSGKTLILKAMSHMLNADRFAGTYGEVNGKDFDLQDRFKWQELDIDTKLVHINDAPRNFNFEGLFNDITEGIRRQRKNERPVLIRPKIYITTNQTISIHGESAVDRSIEFETADYYRADKGPDEEFGHWFFTDWNAEQWNQFDNFMIHCVQLFLRHGLERTSSINLEIRKLKEETSLEFYEWMRDRYQRLHHQEVDSQELMEEFAEYFPDIRKWRQPQRTFNKWFMLFGEFHPGIIRSVKRKSDSKQFFRYELKEPPTASQEEPPEEWWE